jgi:[ribosomal protein S5]-alanine N-acetyltransferase
VGDLHFPYRAPIMRTMFDFATFPILAADRLILRELTRDDSDAMVAIFGLPEMYRFLNQPLVDTPEKAIDLIEWFLGKFQAHEFVTWAITLRSDGRLIGVCGTYAHDEENKRIEIGYHIVPSLWGQGYATEAARAIIGWSFDNLDIHRIEADCTEGNIGSELVMLKCGFKQEGLLRESCWEHERFVNIKKFGLLRREWAAAG